MYSFGYELKLYAIKLSWCSSTADIHKQCFSLSLLQFKRHRMVVCEPLIKHHENLRTLIQPLLGEKEPEQKENKKNGE